MSEPSAFRVDFEEEKASEPPNQADRKGKRRADLQQAAPPAKRFSLSTRAAEPYVIVIDDDDDEEENAGGDDDFQSDRDGGDEVKDKINDPSAAPTADPSSVSTAAKKTKSSRMRAGPVVHVAFKRTNPPSPSPSAVKRRVSLDRLEAWMQVDPLPMVLGATATSIGNDIPQPPLSGGNRGGGATPPPPTARPHGLRAFEPTDWPYQVAHLASNFNSTNIRFTHYEGLAECDCEAPCRVHTCANGSIGIFCTEVSCPFKSKCGNRNGRYELDGLRVMRDVTTNELTLITRKPIDRGVVIGQYVGEMSMVEPNADSEPANEGYRLYMHRDELHGRNERVCINALRGGSRMRFLNHSCDPAACFMEMSHGRERAVVVVTTRRVRADEELTVFYGDKLWFKCRCSVCRTVDAK